MSDSLAEQYRKLAQVELNRGSRMSNADRSRFNQLATQKIINDKIAKDIEKGRQYLKEAEELFGTTEPGKPNNVVDYRYDLREYYGANGHYISPEDMVLHGPADFSGVDVEVPTSTSMPDRPRTVAAAYDRGRKTLTIVFGTGKIYNYYDVEDGEWVDFKNLDTKWKYIRDVLDNKPRGYANRGQIPPQLNYVAYRAYRLSQIGKTLK
jgi:hypothetical protein